MVKFMPPAARTLLADEGIDSLYLVQHHLMRFYYAQGVFFFKITSLSIKIATEVVTLLIIYQIRSSLGGSDDKVGAFEKHKQ